MKKVYAAKWQKIASSLTLMGAWWWGNTKEKWFELFHSLLETRKIDHKYVRNGTWINFHKEIWIILKIGVRVQ